MIWFMSAIAALISIVLLVSLFGWYLHLRSSEEI